MLNEVKGQRYYVEALNHINKLGYNDPSVDTDDRQRKIWQEIEEGNYDIEILTGYDCSNLGPRTSPHYKFFQTRANNEQGIKDYYQEFYVLKKAPERILFGMRMSNGEVFVFVGNKRIRAHEKAINEGLASRCDIVLIGAPNMNDTQKRVVAHRLARMGNKQQNTVRDEVAIIYYPCQLETAYELECEMNPLAIKWELPQIKEWASEWLVNEVSPDFGHKSQSRYRGRIINAAFAEHRGNSLPMPDDEEIEKCLQKYWPDTNWTEPEDDLFKISCSTRHDKMREKMIGHWYAKGQWTPVRKFGILVLRAGKTIDATVTSTETVKQYRQSAIKHLTAWNNNVNVVGAGMPHPTHVMFVKQMDRDETEAYEWDFIKRDYKKVG